jgi:hypothetical protein
MQLIMNDGQQIPIQSAVESGGVLKIRLLNQTSAGLKTIFQDTLAVQKMTIKEAAKADIVYENYTRLTYIAEYTGAIWEVEMRQEAADTDTRLTELESEMQLKADVVELQQAVAELTMTIAALVSSTN